jgi:hypothetical protein
MSCKFTDEGDDASMLVQETHYRERLCAANDDRWTALACPSDKILFHSRFFLPPRLPRAGGFPMAVPSGQLF